MIEPRRPGLWVVIPALNEASTISTTVRELARRAEVVLVVDDGSSDGTGDLARQSGARVLRHDTALGYDTAIADGVNAAFLGGARAAVTCDADGQHRPEDVLAVAEQVLLDRADLACGVRDRYNRPVERLVGWLSRPLFGTRDPFCGMKAYGTRLFERHGPFAPDLHVGSLPLAWARRGGLRASFVPIRAPRRADRPRFAGSLRGNAILLAAFVATLRDYVRPSSTRSA